MVVVVVVLLVKLAVSLSMFRCYNCGEFANHIAAKCPQVRQPKRCHHCKSEEHLIADCPHRAAGYPPTSPSHETDTPDTAAAAAADISSSAPTNDASGVS